MLQLSHFLSVLLRFMLLAVESRTFNVIPPLPTPAKAVVTVVLNCLAFLMLSSFASTRAVFHLPLGIPLTSRFVRQGRQQKVQPGLAVFDSTGSMSRQRQEPAHS